MLPHPCDHFYTDTIAAVVNFPKTIPHIAASIGSKGVTFEDAYELVQRMLNSGYIKEDEKDTTTYYVTVKGIAFLINYLQKTQKILINLGE